MSGAGQIESPQSPGGLIHGAVDGRQVALQALSPPPKRQQKMFLKLSMSPPQSRWSASSIVVEISTRSALGTHTYSQMVRMRSVLRGESQFHDSDILVWVDVRWVEEKELHPMLDHAPEAISPAIRLTTIAEFDPASIREAMSCDQCGCDCGLLFAQGDATGMDAVVSGSMKDQCSPAASHVQHSFAGSETEAFCRYRRAIVPRGIKVIGWRKNRQNTPSVESSQGIELRDDRMVMRDGLFVSM